MKYYLTVNKEDWAINTAFSNFVAEGIKQFIICSRTDIKRKTFFDLLCILFPN